MKLQVLSLVALAALDGALGFLAPTPPAASALRRTSQQPTVAAAARPHAHLVMETPRTGKRAALRRFFFGRIEQQHHQEQLQSGHPGRRRIRKVAAGLLAAAAIRFSLAPRVAHAAPVATPEAQRVLEFEDDLWDEDDLDVLDAADEVAEAAPAAAASRAVSESPQGKKADEGVKLAPTVVGVGTLLYVLARCAGISAKDMSEQRKRVREENTKFQQNAEEYMVEGEVAYSEDLMRELRKMKEDNVGPHDKYAKETRKYNPEFAATHEPVEGGAGGGDSPAAGPGDDDDLLGQEARAADAARVQADEERRKAERAAAVQKLFEQSPEAGDEDNLLG